MTLLRPKFYPRKDWKIDAERAADRGRAREILRFQIPLSLTSLMMATSFSVVNSSLARTGDPQAALAAFALAQSAANMFASPAWITRDLMMALGRDQRSMGVTIRMSMLLTVLVTIWLVAMGFTDLGVTVFGRIFGAPVDLIPDVLAVTRICIILPFAYVVRSWGQAHLLMKRQTTLMTLAMVIRIVFMLVLTSLVPSLGLLSGAMVGAIIWISGISLESLVCAVFALRSPAQLPYQPETGKVCNFKDCLVFLWPLAMNAFMGNFITPLINSGLARTLDPKRNLAVFQVAWSLVWMFTATIQVVRQTVLVFWEDEHWKATLRRVLMRFNLLVSALLFLMVGTGLARPILRVLIGVEEHLIPPILGVLLAMVIHPFITGLAEFKSGEALRMRRTAGIGLAKTVDVIVIAFLVSFMTHFWPQLGPYVGAIAMITGVSVYYLVLRIFLR